MARKPAPTNRTPATAKVSTTESPDSKRAPTLTTLRGEIDQLDQDLVILLNRRAEITSQIGQIKHHQGLEIWSAAREDEVIARALAASQGPLPVETLRLISRELMSGSRSLQRPSCGWPVWDPSTATATSPPLQNLARPWSQVPVGSIAAYSIF